MTLQHQQVVFFNISVFFKEKAKKKQQNPQNSVLAFERDKRGVPAITIVLGSIHTPYHY